MCTKKLLRIYLVKQFEITVSIKLYSNYVIYNLKCSLTGLRKKPVL